jgi:hypothetical protein
VLFPKNDHISIYRVVNKGVPIHDGGVCAPLNGELWWLFKGMTQGTTARWGIGLIRRTTSNDECKEHGGEAKSPVDMGGVFHSGV